MSIIGWILFSFGVLRLGVAAVNFFSRPYLEVKMKNDRTMPVSVLVPARNEEDNIAVLLENYQGWRDEICEIIIYDDLSTDNTYAVASRFAHSDPKVKIIRGGALPEGWLGKNHACDRLARNAEGCLLLFIDADVKLAPETVRKAAATIDRHKLDMLSVFPTQIIDNAGSRLSVPLMNWILLSLLPLVAVRLAPQPSLSAANGQFIMIRAGTYDAVRPHSRFRSCAVEDIAIIRYLKTQGHKVATLLGGRDVYCRMYGNLTQSVEGFSKNIFDFFGGSGVVCWLFVLVTTIAPVWIFIFNGIRAGIIYIAVTAALRILVSAASRQNIAANLLLAIPQQVLLWIITINATVKKRNKKLEWKGRKIY